MPDLNDLQYFAQVVRHGGFSAASRDEVRGSLRVSCLSQLHHILGPVRPCMPKASLTEPFPAKTTSMSPTAMIASTRRIRPTPRGSPHARNARTPNPRYDVAHPFETEPRKQYQRLRDHFVA